MISVHHLIKKYNGITAVNIPHLQIEKGEGFGLVGNNGAGKTTLFRMILDLVRPTEGQVLSKEENVQQTEVWKHYTGSYLDEGFLIDFLTPEEYFQFIGKLNKLTKGDIEESLLRFKDIFNDEILGRKKYIRDLSKGNQKKVGIAAALMSNPEILVLDEPFANLDPSTQIRLKQLLREIKTEKQVSLLISSHDLNHVIEICERIVVLSKGEIVHDIQTSDNTLQELESFFAV